MSNFPMTVKVESRFLPEQSAPEDRVYAFAYAVTITNDARQAAQLIARHWMIQDAAGYTQEVDGLGVIGRQPLLAPGETFRYTSSCQLRAPTGTMHGRFFIVTERAERYDVPIPMVTLEADPGGVPPGARVLH
jgi:ApaG protein